MRALAAALAFAAGAWAAGRQDPDEQKEPPMIFAIEVEGRKVPVELDKAAELPLKAGPVKATLRAEPHRVFTYGGMRFHYPREMGFEADFETEEVRCWTLDGNDTVIMLYRYPENGDHEQLRTALIEGMVAQYGRGNVKRTPDTIQLEKKEIAGTRLNVKIAGARLMQSIYSLQSGKDSVILVLQDSLTDDGHTTAEYKGVLKMFQETFKLTVR